MLDTDAFRNVSIHNLSDFQVWKPLRYEGLTDEQLREVVSFLVGELDKPYDYFQIAGFFFEALFGWRNTWYMKGKYTCGSLIDRAFLVAGIDLVPLRVAGDVTPEDLYGSRSLSEVL